MFLAKLWLRLKGEFFAMKEGLPSEQDLRAKRAQALGELKRRMEGDAEEARREEPAVNDEEAADRDRHVLTGTKNEDAVGIRDKDPPRPNPRRLG